MSGIQVKTILLIAGLLAALGGLLLLPRLDGDVDTFFAYAPHADSVSGPSIYFLADRDLLGVGLLWMASLLASTVLALRFASARLSR